MVTERSEPVMLITCWYLCFQVSRALWFAIRCRCSLSRRSASFPLTFFMILSLALCLCFLFPVLFLSAFTLISSAQSIFGISHAARAGTRDNTRMRY